MIEYDGLALNVAKNPKKQGASLTPRGRKQRDLLDGNAVPLLGAPRGSASLTPRGRKQRVHAVY